MKNQWLTKTITINGCPFQVQASELSYDEIVALSKENFAVLWTMTYSKGVDGAQGIISPGKTVKVKDGMVIHMYWTGAA